jgi:hypothetical protein|tara:strand:+ start:1121 stop:1324 length:204 start_codon:yes stop_codon:yes gene_type:complete
MFNQTTPAEMSAMLQMNREEDSETAAFQELLNRTGAELADAEEEAQNMDALDALPGGLSNLNMSQMG